MRPENPIGEPFFELCEVDSTNNYAIRQVQAQMAGHGATWVAQYQNSGKGQRGKAWNAVHGQNITMSCVLEPAFLGIDNQFVLNVAVALACFDFFSRHVQNGTSIKWPNDIYWKGRKAGGILIENLIQGKEWKYAIAGTGININQTFFPAHLPNAVSLKQITGKSYNVISLAKELCQCLNNRWQQLSNEKYNELLQEYSGHLFKCGEMATFKKDDKMFTAVVAGVNWSGELLADTGSELLALTYGSVEWIIPSTKTDTGKYG